jgi:hypothetical protein
MCSPAVSSRSFTHHSFERFAEGRLRVITHASRNGINLGICGLQKLDRFAETVALKIALRRIPDPHLKPGSEPGAGQVRFLRQCAYGPGTFWALMNQAQNAPDRTISQNGGQPRTIPLRRGTPEEMAKAMLFLASDDSTYCIGSELLVDGGLTQLVNP